MTDIRIRAAVCLVDGDHILLVEHEKHGMHYWLLPGGGVEPGETLVEAAHRELLEETGLEVDVDHLVLVCESIGGEDGHGGRHLVQMVFAGRVRSGRLRPGRDGRLVDARWRPVADLRSIPFFPPIGAEVAALCEAGLSGPVRVLGNVWRDGP